MDDQTKQRLQTIEREVGNLMLEFNKLVGKVARLYMQMETPDHDLEDPACPCGCQEGLD